MKFKGISDVKMSFRGIGDLLVGFDSKVCGSLFENQFGQLPQNQSLRTPSFVAFVSFKLVG